MKLPAGFLASGIAAGIKPSGKKDLGLIHSTSDLHWAMTSTENQLRAACVSRNRGRYATGQEVRSLIVNSGNANCATGDQGLWDNEDFAGMAATALGLTRVQDILTASTGVIGQRLPIAKIQEALPRLIDTLDEDSGAFAEAILTTDTRTKQVAATLSSGARIVGIVKGSGMIHPNMATMLAFVLTDASLPQDTLRDLWPPIVRRSFNQVTVDGDTSPNDMAFLLSSHQLPAHPQEFAEALDAICGKCAEKVARDGEGATKLITVRVEGARSESDALAAARFVAGSSLVKAAMNGNDPNWGRILSALGASGAVWDHAGVRIVLQNVVVYEGAPRPFDGPALSKTLDQEEVAIAIDLAAGDASGTAWGCDLSVDYVHINAHYTT